MNLLYFPLDLLVKIARMSALFIILSIGKTLFTWIAIFFLSNNTLQIPKNVCERRTNFDFQTVIHSFYSILGG